MWAAETGGCCPRPRGGGAAGLLAPAAPRPGVEEGMSPREASGRSGSPVGCSAGPRVWAGALGGRLALARRCARAMGGGGGQVPGINGVTLRRLAGAQASWAGEKGTRTT